MRRLIPFYLLTLLGCVDLGRVVNDPSRLCPSGHRLVVDDRGRPTCVPREEPTPTPSPLPAGTPTPTPNAGTPTITPTAAPTVQPATPTPTPSPSPSPDPPPSCVPRSVLTDVMVPVAYNERPPAWTEPIRDQPDWEAKRLPGYRHYSVAKAGTMDGEVPSRLSWRYWYGLTRQDLVIAVIRGVPVIRDNDPAHPGCFDGLGRWFPGDCSRPYANEEDGDRSPWTSHRHPVPEFCGDEPTPGPTPSGPTPTPRPRDESCTAYCQVVCTVAWLGHNDTPGLPANVVVGGQGALDITCRQAQFPGDQRGQPADRSAGPEWCEPERDPVIWEYDIPAGVEVRVGNDGYRLDLSGLQAGSYSIRVKPREDALDRKGEPIRQCGWGHNSSVKTTLEWSLQ